MQSNDTMLTEKELMFKKKVWDKDILLESGVSYYYPINKDNKTLSNGDDIKKRYRVSLAKGDVGVKLKYKIKTAQGDLFSVASKTNVEAQLIVNELFGKNMYTVSQFIV